MEKRDINKSYCDSLRYGLLKVRAMEDTEPLYLDNNGLIFWFQSREGIG